MTITLKLSFRDDLRRLTVEPASFSFVQLKNAIKRLYNSLGDDELDRLVVKYLDDEGDLVTVRSNSFSQVPPKFSFWLRLHAFIFLSFEQSMKLLRL